MADIELDTTILEAMSREQLALLKWRLVWTEKARDKQLAPGWAGSANGEATTWASWGAMSGRGFGKTLMGASWLGIEAASCPATFNAVIAPTRDDVRYTCFEGETGLLAVIPDVLVADYNKSDLIIYLWNGSLIRGFGSEKPERLRGPQHHKVWCDELATWQYARLCWDMMQFGLRLGKNPQVVWTTTPKPVPIIKQRMVEEDEKHVVTRGTTYENRANLAESFFNEVAKYEGTQLGRQELRGELIDPEESGIVKRSQWRLWPHDKPLPKFSHVVYSLDTAFTEKTFDSTQKEPDPSACIVWGLFQRIHGKTPLYHVMLLDCWNDFLGFPQLVEKVRTDMRNTYGEIDQPLLQDSVIPSRWTKNPVRVGQGIDVLLVEDKGSGISLRQTLAMENIFMEPYNPGRADKLARLHSVTPMFAHGRVWAPESELNLGQPKSWTDEAISEICSFHGPGTVDHDDYVDACTQALRYFMNKFVLTFITGDNEEFALEIAQQEEAEAIAADEPYVNPYLS